MTFLCDTNVISELVRLRPNAGVLGWAAGVTSLVVSAVTIEEIAYGLAWRPNPRVQAWFETVFPTYRSVLPVTAEIAARAGQLRGELARRGSIRSQSDMLIAATAQVNALTVVTRNVKDFENCLVPLLNPFV